MLLARSAIEKPDAFSTQAIRHIKEIEREFSFRELATLASNPDPLVRAFAYTKLEVKTPRDCLLVKRLATVEKTESLNKMLMDKIDLAEICGTSN